MIPVYYPFRQVDEDHEAQSASAATKTLTAESFLSSTRKTRELDGEWGHPGAGAEMGMTMSATGRQTLGASLLPPQYAAERTAEALKDTRRRPTALPERALVQGGPPPGLPQGFQPLGLGVPFVADALPQGPADGGESKLESRHLVTKDGKPLKHPKEHLHGGSAAFAGADPNASAVVQGAETVTPLGVPVPATAPMAILSNFRPGAPALQESGKFLPGYVAAGNKSRPWMPESTAGHDIPAMQGSRKKKGPESSAAGAGRAAVAGMRSPGSITGSQASVTGGGSTAIPPGSIRSPGGLMRVQGGGPELKESVLKPVPASMQMQAYPLNMHPMQTRPAAAAVAGPMGAMVSPSAASVMPAAPALLAPSSPSGHGGNTNLGAFSVAYPGSPVVQLGGLFPSPPKEFGTAQALSPSGAPWQVYTNPPAGPLPTGREQHLQGFFQTYPADSASPRTGYGQGADGQPLSTTGDAPGLFGVTTGGASSSAQHVTSPGGPGGQGGMSPALSPAAVVTMTSPSSHRAGGAQAYSYTFPTSGAAAAGTAGGVDQQGSVLSPGGAMSFASPGGYAGAGEAGVMAQAQYGAAVAIASVTHGPGSGLGPQPSILGDRAAVPDLASDYDAAAAVADSGLETSRPNTADAASQGRGRGAPQSQAQARPQRTAGQQGTREEKKGEDEDEPGPTAGRVAAAMPEPEAPKPFDWAAYRIVGATPSLLYVPPTDSEDHARLVRMMTNARAFTAAGRKALETYTASTQGTVTSEVEATMPYIPNSAGLPLSFRHAYPTSFLLALVHDLCEEINASGDNIAGSAGSAAGASPAGTGMGAGAGAFSVEAAPIEADLPSAWLWFLSFAADARVMVDAASALVLAKAGLLPDSPVKAEGSTAIEHLLRLEAGGEPGKPMHSSLHITPDVARTILPFAVPLQGVAVEDAVLRLTKRMLAAGRLPSLAACALFARTCFAFAGWGSLNVAAATVMRSLLANIAAAAEDGSYGRSRSPVPGFAEGGQVLAPGQGAHLESTLPLLEAILLEPTSPVPSSVARMYNPQGVRVAGVLVTPSQARQHAIAAASLLNTRPSRGDYYDEPVSAFDKKAWTIAAQARNRAVSVAVLESLLTSPIASLTLHFSFVRECMACPPPMHAVQSLQESMAAAEEEDTDGLGLAEATARDADLMHTNAEVDKVLGVSRVQDALQFAAAVAAGTGTSPAAGNLTSPGSDGLYFAEVDHGPVHMALVVANKAGDAPLPDPQTGRPLSLHTMVPVAAAEAALAALGKAGRRCLGAAAAVRILSQASKFVPAAAVPASPSGAGGSTMLQQVSFPSPRGSPRAGDGQQGQGKALFPPEQQAAAVAPDGTSRSAEPSARDSGPRPVPSDLPLAGGGADAGSDVPFSGWVSMEEEGEEGEEEEEAEAGQAPPMAGEVVVISAASSAPAPSSSNSGVGVVVIESPKPGAGAAPASPGRSAAASALPSSPAASWMGEVVVVSPSNAAPEPAPAPGVVVLMQ